MLSVWLCLSALAAGAVNAIAGGGTLLTFPALEFALGSAHLANATSTVALFPGSVAGAWGFRKELAGCRRWVYLLAGPSLVGGAVGALLVEAESFRALIPWLILTAALLFAVQPLVGRLVRRVPAGEEPAPPRGPALVGIVLAQFVIAVYGGYFGAGIGILMLSTLSFLNLASIHQVNGLKNFLAFCINGTAAVLFVLRGLPDWRHAPLMAAASIAGGYLGARLALKLKPVVVRVIVIAIGLGLAAYYFSQQWSVGP